MSSGVPAGMKYAGRMISCSVSFVQYAPDVDDADDVVELPGVDRLQGVVRGRELVADLLDRPVDVDRFDLTARGHHVVDGDVLEFEQVEQDVSVLLRDVVRALQHQGAQLLHRQRIAVAVLSRLQADDAQERAHEQVDEPHHGIDEAQQRREHVRHAQRDRLGIGGADHLRGDLAEHQDREGHGQRAQAQGELAVAEELHGDDRDECRAGRVDEVLPEQEHAEQTVGVLQQIGRQARSPIAGLDQMAQAETIERHHAGLGEREERREEQESDEDADQQT